MKKLMKIHFLLIVFILTSCSVRDLHITEAEDPSVPVEITPTDAMSKVTNSSIATPTISDSQSEELATIVSNDNLHLADLSGSLIFTGNIYNVQIFIMNLPCSYADESCTLSEVAWRGSINVDPEISPDGRLLAFSSDKDTTQGKFELYIYDFTSQEYRRLTNTQAVERNPTWSPNGLKIAFESLSGEIGGLGIINKDGCCEVTVSEPERLLTKPTWAPGGNQIAYLQQFPDAINGTLFIYDIETRNKTRVSEMSGSSLVRPVWSSDGKSLTYIPARSSQEKICSIQIETLQRNCSLVENWYFSIIGWHSNRIFVSATNHKTPNLRSIGFFDFETKTYHQITSFNERISNPVLSQDGNYILFNIFQEKITQPRILLLENLQVVVPIETEFGLEVEDAGHWIYH